MSLKEKIDLERLPKHVAIIMDGNGRWAKSKGKPRVFGHQSGVTSVREAAESAAELGIPYLTLYAFSTENWNRPRFEVTALMRLLLQTINDEVVTLNKNNIRLNAIGDLESLPKLNRERLLRAMDETSKNDRMTLTLALSYSSRWEIVQAARKLAELVENGSCKAKDVDQACFEGLLTTKGMPDPELLIRTSGESRISNFMLWQIAYAELYFSQKFWPDFRKEDLYEAILDYQCRERRFGKTSEQLTKKK
ncbi:MAG: isoprenyl transferase [Bacteroidetes bacterium]|nr:isoprenyl transferase [Bacteroidota bacterium]MBU1580679.1 isoprenyl transferase [Bacteroidota bacterium]MBU2466470.1 isoprenyl transferase [Bacteroidota bacterium]MBU2559116.1 isoprenyl transferase [Bacteroidota bacterium]